MNLEINGGLPLLGTYWSIEVAEKNCFNKTTHTESLCYERFSSLFWSKISNKNCLLQ